MSNTVRVRAQSLQPGDKLRAKVLRGTVVSADKKGNAIPGTLTVHVVVRQANGKLVCKDFTLGYCLAILERERVSENV